MPLRLWFVSEAARVNYQHGLWRVVPATRDTLIWRSADGGVRVMDDIDDNHLLNIVRFIEGRGQMELRPEASPYTHEQAYPLFIEEVNRRGLQFKETPHPDAVQRRMEREEYGTFEEERGFWKSPD